MCFQTSYGKNIFPKYKFKKKSIFIKTLLISEILWTVKFLLFAY